MTQAMSPVITKIPKHGRQNPQQDAAHRAVKPVSLPLKECEIAKDKRPNGILHELREVAAGLTDDAGAQTVDRIIAAVVSSLLKVVDSDLN